MKIAILGWDHSVLGSRRLKLADAVWHADGPLLPIEFARQAAAERLALTVCNETWVWDVPTLWALSGLDTVADASHNLAVQLGIQDARVGHLNRDGNDAQLWLPQGAIRDHIVRRLLAWLRAHDVDAVIWPDLPPDFDGVLGHSLDEARAAVVQRFGQAPANDTAAKSYVQSVPLQVWTTLRGDLTDQLGWLPKAEPAIRSADDLRLKDWDECRSSIGRFDTILVDLRKYGFSFITGLLTASAFLGASAGPAAVPAFIAVMVLVAALFSADTYYQILESAAVERALDLEAETDPQLRTTMYISANATKNVTAPIAFSVYLLLLLTAGGLGLWFAGGLGLGIWSTGPQVMLSLPFREGLLAWLWVLVVIVLIVVYVGYAYRGQLPVGSKLPDRLGPVLGGALAVVFTVGLGMLLSVAGSDHPTSAAARWTMGLLTLLAVYIEGYWFYVAWQSGLYRHRSRGWAV